LGRARRLAFLLSTYLVAACEVITAPTATWTCVYYLTSGTYVWTRLNGGSNRTGRTTTPFERAFRARCPPPRGRRLCGPVHSGGPQVSSPRSAKSGMCLDPAQTGPRASVAPSRPALQEWHLVGTAHVGLAIWKPALRSAFGTEEAAVRAL